jgi:ubiquinone/menaquinone biosynthesis C-methylase UbiE
MQKQNWKFVNSLRASSFKIIYKFGFKTLSDTGPWHDPLIESLKPRDGERILDVSFDGWRSGVHLAQRFPATHIVSLGGIQDKNRNSGNPIQNLELLVRNECHVACQAASIDKIVCGLVLHTLQPEQKALLVREMLRVLRHGGSLHIADYDRPLGRRDSSMLRAASYFYGERATLAHLDGTWVDMISKAGFVGVRRLATYPEFLARVALVRARRQ